MPRLKIIERAGRRLLFGLAGYWRDSLEVIDSVSPGAGLKRILIMRQDRTGDMIMTLPLLRALRRAHPGVELAVVTSPGGAAVLRYEEGSEVIVLRKRPGEFLSTLAAVRKFAPDAAVDMHMHDSTTSFLFTLFSGASWRLHVERINGLPFNVRVRVRLSGHIMDAFTGLLEGLGRELEMDPEDRIPSLSAGEREFASAFWRLSGASPDECVSVNISAGGENRWWGVRNYSELCIRLLSAGLTPLILHAPEHRERACVIARSSPGSLLSPPTATILHTAALIDGTALVISPDTAVVHLAAALGIPVTAMYLPPEKDLPNWLPWKVPNRVLLSDSRASLAGIQPSETFEAARSLLRGREERRDDANRL